MDNDFSFIELDVNEIKKQIKNGYEEIMQVKIQTGDAIEDFIDWVTYILSLSKNHMNFIGRMNLLQYSEGKYLDALGALVDVNRIIEKEAEYTVEYIFSKIFDEKKLLKKGIKLQKEIYISRVSKQ